MLSLKMSTKLVFLLIAIFILMLSGKLFAAVSSCYKCSGCTNPCDGSTCTDKEFCYMSTGTDLCYMGHRTADGKWDQGCGSNSTSFSAFDIYGTCRSTNCNPTNGKTCYVSTAASRPENTKAKFCSGSYTSCYVALDSNNMYNQGCGTFSSVSSSFTNFRLCSTSDCNTASLSCFSCTQCSYSSGKSICTSPNDALCYIGYNSDGTYDMGCAASTATLTGYTRITNCSTDFCNYISNPLTRVTSCYTCNGCTTPCDGSNCTSTLTCDSSTGDDFCYLGQRTADGKWDQGCALYSKSYSAYNTYQKCQSNNCNPTNGKSCYESTSARRPTSSNSKLCTGSDNLCFIALDSNNMYNQGCGTLSTLLLYPTKRSCSTSNCNTASLSCYSCVGCNSSSTITICSSPDDALCYIGYNSDGTYDMGCAASTATLTGYTKITDCSTHLCNYISASKTTAFNNSNILLINVTQFLINLSAVFAFLVLKIIPYF